MQHTKYVRLFADEQGESHFDEVEVTLTPVDFAPPAPPLNYVSLFPATQCSLIGIKPEWAGDTPHPGPRRQLMCCIQGELEVTVSDGEVRRFGVGDMVLLADTTGKGHSTRPIQEGFILVINLAD